MSVSVTVSCDGVGCRQELAGIDYNESIDNVIESAGWHFHSEDDNRQYCERCWPIVEQELKEQGLF